MGRIILAVSGTPCTGKTTLAKRLSRELGFNVIHLSDFIKKERLSSGFDRKRGSLVVDMGKLARKFKTATAGRENVIADGLLSHFLPVTHIIVLRASPLILQRRMKKRGYSRKKIMENLEAEYLGTILHESQARCKNILELDSTRRVNVKNIRKWLKDGGVRVKDIDWSKEFMKTLNR